MDQIEKRAEVATDLLVKWSVGYLTHRQSRTRVVDTAGHSTLPTVHPMDVNEVPT